MITARWEQGYTQAELDDAQAKFGLVFPPDLVALLRDRRPSAGHLWTDEVAIRKMLAWPFEGLLFDVENNGLWWPEWGERPASPNEREDVMRAVVARYKIGTIDCAPLPAGKASRTRQPCILCL